uniref:Uncharacterized protein n=1 Tax=Anguilla anguilla TaxID=7936 RepID=A0A0E9X9J1_ANGAN
MQSVRMRISVMHEDCFLFLTGRIFVYVYRLYKGGICTRDSTRGLRELHKNKRNGFILLFDMMYRFSNINVYNFSASRQSQVCGSHCQHPSSASVAPAPGGSDRELDGSGRGGGLSVCQPQSPVNPQLGFIGSVFLWISLSLFKKKKKQKTKKRLQYCRSASESDMRKNGNGKYYPRPRKKKNLALAISFFFFLCEDINPFSIFYQLQKHLYLFMYLFLYLYQYVCMYVCIYNI